MKRCCWGLAALLALVAGAGRTNADVVYNFTQGGNGPAGDGPVNAQATFTAYNGGILVTIDNLQLLNGGNGEGQSISGISFNLGSALQSSGVVLAKDSGPAADVYGTTVVQLGDQTGYPSDGTLHWGSKYNTVNGGILLETAGVAAQPQKPNYLIVGALAPGGSYNSSYVQHNPNFYLEAKFWIADSAVTSNTILNTSNITNVQFAFGTGPAFGGPATGSNVTPVPAPGGLALLGIGAACLGAYARRRRPAAV